MKAFFLPGLCLLALSVLPACSHAPRLARSSEDVATLRSEYLKNNPSGVYNEHIVKGEVKKGMNVVEVLASWGLPHLRRGRQESDTESWVYYSLDEHTQKVVSYELVFVKRSLSRWLIGDTIPGLGILTPRDLIGTPTAGTTPDTDVQSSESGTLKKKP